MLSNIIPLKKNKTSISKSISFQIGGKGRKRKPGDF
jgi:hypothetical protein